MEGKGKEGREGKRGEKGGGRERRGEEGRKGPFPMFWFYETGTLGTLGPLSVWADHGAHTDILHTGPDRASYATGWYTFIGCMQLKNYQNNSINFSEMI